MEPKEYIHDTGLFAGQKTLDFKLDEPFETISNLLKTIQEYRDYHQPDSQTWGEYILEVFHIMQFGTEPLSPRLILLKDIGNSHSRAILGQLHPGENWDQIALGVDWETYLLYAGHYHQVEWAVLTDGLELRVLHLSLEDYKRAYFWANLEGVLADYRLDSFYALYKVFAYIRGRQNQPSASISRRQREQSPKLGRQRTSLMEPSGFTLADHINHRPQSTVDLLMGLRERILSLSDGVAERITKFYIAYADYKKICEIHVQSFQLKIWVYLDIEEISDPQSLCRDVRNIGHYGNGSTEISLKSADDLDAAMDIIKQSYTINCAGQ